MVNEHHVGSAFESFLEEEGALTSCTANALERVRRWRREGDEGDGRDMPDPADPGESGRDGTRAG